MGKGKRLIAPHLPICNKCALRISPKTGIMYASCPVAARTPNWASKRHITTVGCAGFRVPWKCPDFFEHVNAQGLTTIWKFKKKENK